MDVSALYDASCYVSRRGALNFHVCGAIEGEEEVVDRVGAASEVDGFAEEGFVGVVVGGGEDEGAAGACFGASEEGEEGDAFVPGGDVVDDYVGVIWP